MTDLISNQFLEQAVSGNCEEKARKKHSQRNDDRSSESVSKPTIYKASLETHKRRENHQWCRKNIANGNAVEEDTLRQPGSL